MPAYLTPGAYFETVDTNTAAIVGVRTDIAGFVGLAERGPVSRPVRIGSFEQFQATFGSFLPEAFLAYTVKAFFENGGDTCFAVRVAAGALAARTTFADDNGMATLLVEAASPGSWGNGVDVRITHAAPAATATGARPQAAHRQSSLVETIVDFPAGSLVKLFQTVSPSPLEAFRIVAAVDGRTRALTWDAPLDAAFDLTRSISLETVTFSLSVSIGGRLVELFDGLSLVPEHPRYVNNALGQGASNFIRAADLGSPSPFPQRLPLAEIVPLAGGTDGLANLTAFDFIGDPVSEEPGGIRALEREDLVSVVAVPDILVQPQPEVERSPEPQPPPDPCLPCPAPPALGSSTLAPTEHVPQFSLEDVFLVQQALVDHCEQMKDRFALLDYPLAPRPGEQPDLGEVQSWRQQFGSTFAALYFPWPLIYDPLHLAGRVVRAVPPCGHVAGVYARTDLEKGVHAAPANVELRWAQALSVDVSARQQGFLNPLSINCLRSFRGRGLRVFGARTVSSNHIFRYVNVRRLMLMIEESLLKSLQWAVFEPNNFLLRQTLVVSISNFLSTLWERGALVGESAEDAYQVTCDEQNNPPGLAELGQLVADVGVAPVRPAEFVIFRIGRSEQEIEITEQGT